MKLVKLVALACLFPLLTSADETDPEQKPEKPLNSHLNYKLGLRAYNITTVTPDFRLATGQNTAHEHKFTQYLHPSIALQIASRKHNFHEIELTDVTIDKTRDVELFIDPTFPYFPTQGKEITRTSIAVRYEFIRPLIKKENARLVPALGVAGMGYYERNAFQPATTATYPSSYTQLGIRGFIVPRVTWYATKRVYFDVNIPLPIIDMSLNMQKVNNPTYPDHLRNYNIVSFEMLPEYYTFRAGVGVKL